ncbi:Acbp from Moniliophthora Perniciosa [Chiua virens]|nr:Acbp from Moniliophthora Perniciosa [Chiua virens]
MPLTLQEKFDKCAKYVQSLPKDGPYQPDVGTKLNYYAFYKQGTEGDVTSSRPGMLQFVEKSKWDAWNGVKGISKEEAQQKYVELLIQNLEKIEPKSEELVQVLKELKE